MTHGEISTLLPGDLNREGASLILDDPALAAKLEAHMLKAPHHSSQEFLPALIAAIRPRISTILSGDDIDNGHPRVSFVGTVGRYSRSNEPLVFSTEIAANVVEAGETAEQTEDKGTAEHGDVATSEGNTMERRLFKRRLHRMINIRTDG